MDRQTIFKMVKASGVCPGEMILVHFWGEDADKEIANSFMVAVAAMGATPVLLQQARTQNRDIFAVAGDSCFDKRYFEMLSHFDAVLDVFAYQPIVLGYDIGDGAFEHYRNYIARLFSKLMEFKRFTQIRIPTEANAEESGLEAEEYIRRMEAAYDIDYDAVRTACEEKLSGFRNVRELSLRTGEDCLLKFELGEREWHADCGDGDLPCGEVYIAPLEEKTQGKVFFEQLYLEDEVFGNVVLEIKNGTVCGSNAPGVMAFLEKQPVENRVVCELGFGVNPNVKSLCGYTVLDEKMEGTFHIALGANHMFGGENKASAHMDFVGQGELKL